MFFVLLFFYNLSSDHSRDLKNNAVGDCLMVHENGEWKTSTISYHMISLYGTVYEVFCTIPAFNFMSRKTQALLSFLFFHIRLLETFQLMFIFQAEVPMTCPITLTPLWKLQFVT